MSDSVTNTRGPETTESESANFENIAVTVALNDARGGIFFRWFKETKKSVTDNHGVKLLTITASSCPVFSTNGLFLDFYIQVLKKTVEEAQMTISSTTILSTFHARLQGAEGVRIGPSTTETNRRSSNHS